MRIVPLLFLVFLAACAPRGLITIYPEAENIGTVQSIFVATTRARTVDGKFTGHRSPVVSYLHYNISIPPAHNPGEINWPNIPPDPQKDFLVTREDRFQYPSQFASALSRSLRARKQSQREVVIFVHGFNNNFAEGLYRMAQLSHDFDLAQPTIHYSWPSAGNPLGYGYDRDSILFARDGLEELIKTVDRAGARKILLVGHSMGALLVMETLRQISIENLNSANRLIDGVALLSPDIDIELFKQQTRRIGRLPDPFVIFTSRKDRALRLSARLTGQKARLGNVDDARLLADLKVTLVDVSEFSTGAAGHFTTAKSPTLIRLFSSLPDIDAAFRRDRSGRSGLLPGTVLVVQKATEIILLPVSTKTP